MRGWYSFKIPALMFMALLILAGINVGAQQPASNSNNMNDLRLLEEEGLDLNQVLEAGGNPELKPEVRFLPLPNDSVLLIPESTNDRVGMYDPFDGSYLGEFIDGTGLFSTPICAMAGPDGNIYVSDQVADAVFVYDRNGTYLYTYADGSDGLNNIRGIDFRNDTLFVTSGDDYVAWFSGPHTRISPDFINDGSDTYDILFLADGKALVADIQGTTDNVRLYNADGTLNSVLVTASFPEQVQFDDLAPGDYLTAFFSANATYDFDITGTVYQTTPWGSGRGAYRLGNGNLLLTSGSGVYEVVPGTGAIVDTAFAGVSGRFIELVVPSGPPPEYGSISGTVTEFGTGTPVVGAHVVAEGTAIGAYTDVNGDYTLPGLLPDTYNVIFTHAGYNDSTVTGIVVNANENTVLDVQMTVYTPAYGSIGGTVTDAVSAGPIENVHVTVQGETVEDYTDSNGDYLLENLFAGDYTVIFSHPDYDDSTIGSVTVIENETTVLDVSLTLATGSIAGVVTDVSTTDPIEGVYVVAEGTTVEAYTDISGQYTLADLNPGDYNVIFSHSSYNDTTVGPVTVLADQVTALDVAMSTPTGYQYFAGDANMFVGQWPPQVIGGDVTFLVNYFRGAVQACLVGGFYCSGDANGDCQVIGSDVTRMVNYFRGTIGILPCPDFESAWPTPADLPETEPDGWPNCEVPPLGN